MPGYYSAVEDIYALSDIICLPSLMEGLGLVVLEAMYFKVPVIASNVGGIPEIIKDGVNGLLVKPRDSQALASAVIRVISDQKLRNQLIIEGQKKVSEFSPENMANRVENIYNKLLQQRGSLAMEKLENRDIICIAGVDFEPLWARTPTAGMETS
jgi:glycosyltransferase involved in cell wall biosynthesis